MHHIFFILRSLTDNEIATIIEGWDESEDEFFVDDDENNVEISLNRLEYEEEANGGEISRSGEEPNINERNDLLSLKQKYERTIWKQKEFAMDLNTDFKASEELPEHFLNFSGPYSYFTYFFSDELMNSIVYQSNLYTCQKNPDSRDRIDQLDLQKFLGICIMMSVIQIPNNRRYWTPIVGNKLIQETMSVNRFEKIKSMLHFNDNNEVIPRENPKHDRLFKIRPVVKHLVEKFMSVPFENCLSVDEQLCSTKCKSYLKQYLPMKPNKWGFKLYVLAGVSGYNYNFEIYTGQENNLQYRLPEERDLGACANIVIRLLRPVPSEKNFKVFFDNYYTSLPLMITLANRGIFSLGTVRRNRIPNLKLPDDKIMMKKPRGESCEYVATVDNFDISVVSWRDNKIVNLMSNFCGKNPEQSVERFDKKLGRKITVDCPNIVSEYNKFMGGVDLLDSFIGRNKIQIRSKKWYMRLFYHLVDTALVNAWLLYKRAELQKGNNVNETLADFRLKVGETLCKMGKTSVARGRPSDLTKNLALKVYTYFVLFFQNSLFEFYNLSF